MTQKSATKVDVTSDQVGLLIKTQKQDLTIGIIKLAKTKLCQLQTMSIIDRPDLTRF